MPKLVSRPHEIHDLPTESALEPNCVLKVGKGQNPRTTTQRDLAVDQINGLARADHPAVQEIGHQNQVGRMTQIDKSQAAMRTTRAQTAAPGALNDD